MPNNEKKSVPTKKDINDLMSGIKSISQQKFPTMRDYLTGDASTHFSQIQQALAIINSYNDGDKVYELSQASEDLVRLAAIHASISEMVGYLQGLSSTAESSRKMMKSKAAIQIRAEKSRLESEGEMISITTQDIDNASRVMAIESYSMARDAETISRMISAAWSAIGKFIQILNSVVARSSREEQSGRLIDRPRNS